MKKVGYVVLGLVLLLVLVVGWTNQPKDGHNINNYTLTFDELAFSGGSAEVFAVVCEKIYITAASGNGAVLAFIGGSDVANDGDNGYQLAAGESVIIDSYITATSLYVIGDSSGQVSYICFN